MGLRLTTAMPLILAAGILAACGEDDEVATTETVTGDEAVIVAEEEVVTDEEVVAEVEAEEELVVSESVTEDDPVELDTDVTEVVDDAEAVVDEAGAEVADVAEAEITEEVAEVEALDAEGLDAEAGTATLVETDESPAEVTADMSDAEVEAAEEAASQAASVDEGETVLGNDGDATAGADDGMIELDTNVTVADASPALNSAGEADAEAIADPAASEEVMVEETNDVGTDGIDSGSELTMTDFDDLVLDEEGVQRLTTFIESSDAIDANQKITLVAGLDAARDEPDRLAEILEQVREIVSAGQ
jgi:hypothetical protein